MHKVRWAQATLVGLAALVFIGCGGGGGGGGSTGTSATSGSTSTAGSTSGSTSGGTVAVAIAPTDATTVVGGQRHFTSTVTGNANTNVTWTVTGGSANGTVTSSGLYTAPNTPGTYTVVATSQADPSKTASVQVVVGSTAFIHTGDLPGGIFSSGVQGLSANGTVAVGFGTPTPPSGQAAANNVAVWKEIGGLVAATNVGPGVGYATDATGTTVVGTRQSTGIRAFQWTQAGGVQDLTAPAGALGTTTALDVSADGSVIVGWFFDASNQQRAVKWVNGTPTNLGVFPGGSFSSATAVSADGTVIVGQSGVTGGANAVRWSNGNPASKLGTLVGGTESLAHDVSADGSIIVGESGTNVGGTPHTAAFSWTQGGGMVNIGSLNGGSTSARAYAVSGNGSRIVGESQTGATAQDTEAVIWLNGGAPQNLKTYLSARGMATPLTGWVLTKATAISQDGKVVAGVGTNPSGQPEGWIAMIP